MAKRSTKRCVKKCAKARKRVPCVRKCLKPRKRTRKPPAKRAMHVESRRSNDWCVLDTRGNWTCGFGTRAKAEAAAAPDERAVSAKALSRARMKR